MKIKLTTVPDPTLRQVSKPLTQIDKKLTQTLERMAHILVTNEPPGVGLSGVQVGYLKTVYIAQFPNNTSLPLKEWGQTHLTIRHFINPTIIKTSKKLYLGDTKGDHQLEGCLSIPKVWGFVWRHTHIRLRFQEIVQGQLVWREEDFAGFPARVLQHEQDHLEGILFTDHITGRSPIKGFSPLKTHKNPLLFEQDGDMIPIQNPEAFSAW